MGEMKRFILLALLLFACPAKADMYPDASNAKLPDARRNMGVPPHVATNAALTTSSTVTYPTGIWRDDFAAGNGASPLWYMPGASACALNAGAGDNGSQVKSQDGKCWLAMFPASGVSPAQFGAKGDGTTDDTAALNAALAYLGMRGSGTLRAREGAKYAISGTITIKDGTSFVGAGWDNSYIKLLNGTITPAIKMEPRTELRNWYIDATPQNAGVVIQMGSSASDYRSLVSRVLVYKGCVGIDVEGVGHSILDSWVNSSNAVAGCGGIRVGHNTTGAGTVETRIVNTSMVCDYTLSTRADYGLLVEDAGGMYYGPGVDNIGCINGTVIKPGANQQVALMYANDAVFGDTAQQIGLLIDTGAPTAVVNGNMFVQTWTSAATSPGGTGVVIQNTGGGKIAGNSFIGHRVYQNYSNGIEIKTPVSGTITDTTFDAIRICNTQTGTDFLVDTGQSAAIRNSRIGKQCDGLVAGNTTGLLYGIGLGSNTVVTITGNDLSYTGAETWDGLAGVPTGDSVIANNKGPSNGAGGTYASASTVTLVGVDQYIHLTGTTTVNTITPTWNGQPLCVISDSGAISFGTTGNIKAAVTTSGAGGMVCGHYDSSYSKWYLH
jgi:hypothetical protein